MNTKLTLRVEESVVRKAKRLAKKRGSSVSKLFSQFIAEAKEEDELKGLGEVTSSMVGVMSASEMMDAKKSYHSYLEEKYL